MIIGVHPDQTGTESYSEKWSDFLRDRGLEVRQLNLLSNDALNQASCCDGVMWRWIHTPQQKQSARQILFTIERYLKIPVYPDFKTSWHYDEKISQFYLLQLLDAHVPDTWVFWIKENALDWTKIAPYPVVFKLSPGAGSSNVLKVKNQTQAESLINQSFNRGIFPYTMNEFHLTKGFPRSRHQGKMFLIRVFDSLKYVWSGKYPRLNTLWWKPEFGYAYFQEFISGNEFDTRITIIGDRAFGYRRMNRPNDFRASGSGNFDADPHLIDQRCVEIAFQLSRRGQFQCMAYDFLFKEDEPVVCEISYTFVDWMVKYCPGHWTPDLVWHAGEMWPEEAQVEDFVDIISKGKQQ